jgi:hypothetical protein
LFGRSLYLRLNADADTRRSRHANDHPTMFNNDSCLPTPAVIGY